MRYGSVCSGIEAASVAWEPLGWQAAWFAEIEPFPSRVLATRFPAVPNLGDMTALEERIIAGEVEAPDLLVGGTPCQAFSVAGLRGSLSDARGNLALVFVRLANAIDRARAAAGKPPAWIVWENVPGVLSTKDNAFGALLAGLVGADSAIAPRGRWTDAGVVAGPRRTAAWRILDAQFFGVAQRRRRVFVLARGGAGAWAVADALLPLGPRGSGDSAPRREAREDAAGGAPRGAVVGRVVGALCSNKKAAGSATSQDAASGMLVPELAGTLGAKKDGGWCGGLDSSGAYIPASRDAAAFNWQSGGDCRGLELMPVTSALTRIQTPAALSSEGQRWVVRRLTPTECERLQGFPRDWTLIDGAADGPRYRALGNSMAVPVMHYIGKRIEAQQ